MKQQLTKITRKILPAKVTHKIETVYRKSRLKILSTAYGNPAEQVKVIAITGTNGKTTSMSVLNEILKAAGKTTILTTTAGREVAGEHIDADSCSTVPSTKELQQLFRLAIDKQVDYLLLEVTSHALTQYKLPKMQIEAAGFTNLTQEHLDYHGTMASYADAKIKLFTDFNAKHKLLNADDQWFNYFKQKIGDDIASYGTAKNADFRIKKVKLFKRGSEITILHNNEELMVSTPLAGKFNAYNVTLAVAIALSLGIDNQSIIEGVANLESVKGRLQWLDNKLGIDVMIDYAHTPDGIEKILELAKEISRGKIHIVFGSAGGRDLSKLPAMGRAAAKYADRIFVTDEENRNEPAENIRNGILQGIKEAGAEQKGIDIADRGEAIESALRVADKGDVVIVAGLGHQNYRNMNNINIKWSDIAETEKILRKLEAEQ
ncbi:MAG: UDP-N-acetylmuramoyl-L-alanyl-D-glutamate--2,6-diaminopimelate ligase [Candidatus Saccharibacteria bacterium]|nr:UDP-N-acetylmuramoyl-L-alanyl-D-glutamate--2,6-diaminopimelate ligase [Candidatus Saccharibacteria bacterium]